jgi:Protein of unknown function (DUF1428)
MPELAPVITATFSSNVIEQANSGWSLSATIFLSDCVSRQEVGWASSLKWKGLESGLLPIYDLKGNFLLDVLSGVFSFVVSSNKRWLWVTRRAARQVREPLMKNSLSASNAWRNRASSTVRNLKEKNMAQYVDGFVLPVPKDKIDLYRSMAEKAAKIWREHGALEYRECIAEDS